MARQAMALQERADRAEASGNFGYADKLRDQAGKIDSRIARREATASEVNTASRVDRSETGKSDQGHLAEIAMILRNLQATFATA
jgi:hypothetical protein